MSATDLAGIACLLVPLALMVTVIVLLTYSIEELRQKIDRWSGKR